MCADHIQEEPELEYVAHVAKEYQHWHKKNKQGAYLLKTQLRHIELDEDLEKGGALVYKKIREPPLPPLQAIQSTTEANVGRESRASDGHEQAAPGPCARQNQAQEYHYTHC